MVTMLSNNLNRDVKEVRLFEQGQIFTGTTETVNETPSTLPRPHHRTAAGDLAAHAHDAPFFELKGPSNPSFPYLNRHLDRSALCRAERTAFSFTPEAPQWLQPGRSATALLHGTAIAHFGELVQTQKDQRKLRQPIYLAQLDLAKLYELPLKKVTARDLSRFQAVERDFSFVFPDAVQWHTIAAALNALAIPELQSVNPVEVWRDPEKVLRRLLAAAPLRLPVQRPHPPRRRAHRLVVHHHRHPDQPRRHHPRLSLKNSLFPDQLYHAKYHNITTKHHQQNAQNPLKSTPPPQQFFSAKKSHPDRFHPHFPHRNPRLARLYFNHMSTSTISVDEFQALEQKVLRAVEIVKREREARATAEAEVASLRQQLTAQQSATESELTTLTKEREAVRQRVEKMLQQMDELL